MTHRRDLPLYGGGWRSGDALPYADGTAVPFTDSLCLIMADGHSPVISHYPWRQIGNRIQSWIPSVLPAISGGNSIDEVQAMGVIETYSVAATIEATDAAVKAASVIPLRMHLAFGIGGKSYVVLSGDVADMNAAVEAGSAVASDKGFLVNRVVIPRPHKQLIDQIM